MTPTEARPSRTSCTAIAAIRKPKTFSVTSMRLSSSLSLTRFAQRNTTTSMQQDEHEDAELHGEDAERLRLGGDRHQADDADRVEQVGHGQRELRKLHRVLASGAVAAAGRRAEHHPHREHEQDQATGDRQGSDREVQQARATARPAP